jgi:transcriptional regulator with XRE-family HTH domain
MQLKTSVGALHSRAARIRMEFADLARAAGMPSSTLYRWKTGSSPNLSSLQRAYEALEAEERALLAHLLALYPEAAAPAPLPTGRGADARREAA